MVEEREGERRSETTWRRTVKKERNKAENVDGRMSHLALRRLVKKVSLV